MKNYYEILGVSKDASQDEIKKLYRKLALEFHPDRNPEGGDRFKDIAEAYETLSDDVKRKEYDYKLENPMAGGFGGGNPFNGNFDDLFNQMFGGNPFRGGNFQQQRRAPEKLIEVQIDVIESYKGVVKDITYSRHSECVKCNGSGGDRTVCNVCSGQGFFMQRAGTGMFTQIVKTPCNGCGGSGYNIINKCYTCNGNGSKEIIETLKITFPRGIDEGQMLRVQQKGDYVQGMIGDLILKVKLTMKNGFEKSGNDLIYNVFFNLTELNKNEFEIPHPDGALSVKFPKEFNTQIPLRLRNKGFITNVTGDLYVKYHVKYIRNQEV